MARTWYFLLFVIGLIGVGCGFNHVTLFGLMPYWVGYIVFAVCVVIMFIIWLRRNPNPHENLPSRHRNGAHW